MKETEKIAKEAGIIPELKLGIGSIGSPPQSTGPHTVVLLTGKEVVGQDFQTKKERREFRILLEEDGEKKTYQMPILDKDDPHKLHYLFSRIVDIPNDTTVVLEMKKGGGGNYIDLSIPGGEKEPEPVVELDEGNTSRDMSDGDYNDEVQEAGEGGF